MDNQFMQGVITFQLLQQYIQEREEAKMKHQAQRQPLEAITPAPARSGFLTKIKHLFAKPATAGGKTHTPTSTSAWLR